VAVGVPFTFVASAPEVSTLTDAARVRQLVDGLLENALRVTPSGRPVVVEVRREAATDVVEVRDGGPGLTDDDLAVAFEPSVLHDRYRGIRPVGTGLGLAIVGRLAQVLGGTVVAGHAPEGGARFMLRLPRASDR
jgi:signal transduction histidine kinase